MNRWIIYLLAFGAVVLCCFGLSGLLFLKVLGLAGRIIEAVLAAFAR